jgi:hypothetical protein
MSALRIIIWSIAGPILIWLALLTHVFYQFAFVDPLPVKVAGWPSGTDESVKDIIIQNRKYILQVRLNYSNLKTHPALINVTFYRILKMLFQRMIKKS